MQKALFTNVLFFKSSFCDSLESALKINNPLVNGCYEISFYLGDQVIKSLPKQDGEGSVYWAMLHSHPYHLMAEKESNNSTAQKAIDKLFHLTGETYIKLENFSKKRDYKDSNTKELAYPYFLKLARMYVGHRRKAFTLKTNESFFNFSEISKYELRNL